MKLKNIAALLLTGALAVGIAGCAEKPDVQDDTFGASYYSYDLSYLTLGNYMGIEMKEDLTVTDDDVRDQYFKDLEAIEELNKTDSDGAVIEHDIYKELKEFFIKDAEAKNGDKVNIDFVGYMDGEKFSGGEGSNYLLGLGSKSFIPGFEDAIIGHKPGETFDINIKFPDPYPNNTGLSGKPVTFTTTLNFIYPELSDETAQIIRKSYGAESEDGKLPDFTDKTSYEKYIRDAIKQSLKDNFEEFLSSNLIYEVYNASKFNPFPEDKIAEVKETYATYAKRYGLDTNTYLYYMYGISSEEEISEFYHFQVGADLVIAAIVQKEHFTISQKEWDEAVAFYLDQYGFKSEDEFLETVGKADFANMILSDKALEFIKENAKITIIE